jgi:pyruvate kinase
MRKTKIVITIGPSTDSPEVIDQLVEHGMDCARLNFSHGTFDSHEKIIKAVRAASEKHNRPVAILQDLGGIKMRLGKIDGQIQLNHGDLVSVIAAESSDDPTIIPFPQPEILKNLSENNLIYISDGTICLEILSNVDGVISCRVRNGGMISSFKGLNLPGAMIDLPVLTEADKKAIHFGIEQGVDWVAVSFVRSLADVRYARDYLKKAGSTAPMMAKLERAEVVENLEEILTEVDGVMVARGDLGVEIDMVEVPIIQKNIVSKAKQAAKVSVIATQMLRSMVVSPTPTRAEVSDICNAVLDGCDAILLSDETAVGAFPIEALTVAARTIEKSEEIYPYYQDLSENDRTQAIASGAARIVRSLGAKPVVVTNSGASARQISRFRPDSEIIVLTHHKEVLNRLAILWGCTAVGVVPVERDSNKLVASIVDTLRSSGKISDKDLITIVYGLMTGVTGTTNAMQVLDMQEYLSSE